MPTLYIDYECHMSKRNSLPKRTLRKYLGDSHVLCVAYATDNGPVRCCLADNDGKINEDVQRFFALVAVDPEWTVVAHNAAFDVRVWRILCGLPQPSKVHCTLELACAAFPNQPGGHSLDNLSRTLNHPYGPKIDTVKGIMSLTPAQLAAYCTHDVVLCRMIHQKCLPRLHPKEIELAEYTNAVRECHFEVDADAVAAAMDEFGELAAERAQEALDEFKAEGVDGADSFGLFEGGAIKSVKPHAMRAALLEGFGFDTPTISFKKMNPEHLRANESPARILKAAEGANKALSHQRNMRKFVGVTEIDAELGYFRAHTGRFSSPSPGCKGLNLHNCPKRDKRLAKLIRSLFRLPSGLCFVRGDLSNVEYRIEGLLSGSEYVASMFTENIFADPYSRFGHAATGIQTTKDDSLRQIFKNCVLGLGFLMGLYRWMCELAKLIADPTLKPRVTLQDMDAMCVAMRWGPPSDPYVKAAMAKARVPWQVASVAYHTRELFHEIHPEFSRLARWLEFATNQLNQCDNHDQAKHRLDRLYAQHNAPKRELLELFWDDSFEGKTVRVRCGLWPAPTVTWRDLGVRVFDSGRCCMAFMNGKKGYWPLSPNLLIENVCQGAARNALCTGVLTLRDMGYPYNLHVHDEDMLIVPSTPADVLAAKADLLSVFGPNAMPGWDWSVVINPSEVNVSQSLYETDCGADWWTALPDHPELLKNLS